MNDFADVPRIRLDKWLWYARFCKSRTLAAKLIGAGGFRVNRELISKPSHAVKPGDVLTFSQRRDVRVIEIVTLGERRGPPAEAQTLYRDLAPPAEREKMTPGKPPRPLRPPGSGRPTKKDRRAIDRLAEASGDSPK